jgi:hypothetical protein
MATVPQTNGRAIIGPPFLTCVELDGTQTPLTELWTGPSEGIDPTDASAWPESNLVDGWFYETDLADVASLEALESERLADLADAPDSAWNRMMAESLPLPPIARSAPEPFEPSQEDLDDYRRWSDRLESLGDAMAFPDPAGPDDRRAFQHDVRRFYATHPDA